MAISFFLVCILAAIVSNSEEKLHDGIVLRTDDTDPLVVVEAQHSAAIADLQAKYSTMQGNFAALESKIASMSTPLVYTAIAGAAKHYQAGAIIHFDSAITDVGGLYDRVSGIITLPQGGTYLVSVRSDPPGDSTRYETMTLRLNSQPLIDAYGEHGSTNSVTVVLRLNAGDRLWLTQAGDGDLEGAAALSVVRISV